MGSLGHYSHQQKSQPCHELLIPFSQRSRAGVQQKANLPPPAITASLFKPSNTPVILSDETQRQTSYYFWE